MVSLSTWRPWIQVSSYDFVFLPIPSKSLYYKGHEEIEVSWIAQIPEENRTWSLPLVPLSVSQIDSIIVVTKTFGKLSQVISLWEVHSQGAKRPSRDVCVCVVRLSCELQYIVLNFTYVLHYNFLMSPYHTLSKIIVIRIHTLNKQ